MLTIEDIKNKVNSFSPGKPVEELIEEIIVMYKIKKGLDDVDNGDVTDWEDFKEEMKSWSISIANTAKIDIRNIHNYVLQQSYQNAELLIQAIFQAIDSLYKFLQRGQIVKEIQNPLFREIRLYKYIII